MNNNCMDDLYSFIFFRKQFLSSVEAYGGSLIGVCYKQCSMNDPPHTSLTDLVHRVPHWAKLLFLKHVLLSTIHQWYCFQVLHSMSNHGKSAHHSLPLQIQHQHLGLNLSWASRIFDVRWQHYTYILVVWLSSWNVRVHSKPTLFGSVLLFLNINKIVCNELAFTYICETNYKVSQWLCRHFKPIVLAAGVPYTNCPDVIAFMLRVILNTLFFR